MNIKVTGNKNGSFTALIHLFCALLIIIFVIFTMRDVRLVSEKIISTFLFLCIWILFFIYKPGICMQIFFSKKNVVSLIFILFTSIYYILVGDTESFLIYVRSYCTLFSLMFFSDYLLKLNDRKMLKIIFYGLILGYIYISINLLDALFSDPMIARQLAASQVTDDLAILSVGGGYGLITALSLLIPFLVLMLFNNMFKNKLAKIFIILSISLFLLTVIKSNFAIAFVFTCFGIYLVWFLRKSKRELYRKIVIYLFFLSILLVYSDIVIVNLFDFLLGILNEDSVLYARLNDFKLLLLYGEYSLNTEARFYFYKLSIDTFFNNPIFGNFLYVLENNMDEKIYFGGHSEWLDMLAKYGAFGVLPIFLFLYYQVNTILRLYKKSKYEITNIIPYILFFTLGWFNFVNKFIIFVVIGLIVPISSTFFEKKINDV